MKKVILIVILSILTLSFLALIFNAYDLQKKYFDSKGKNNATDSQILEEESKPVVSYYTDYAKEEYEKALSEKRVLVLYFTSNWCKECIEQDTLNREAFSSLLDVGAIGLKIHILDSETTTETDALAKKYGVSKEQSFVVLNKQGAIHFKHTGVLAEELLKQKIEEVK